MSRNHISIVHLYWNMKCIFSHHCSALILSNVPFYIIAVHLYIHNCIFPHHCSTHILRNLSFHFIVVHLHWEIIFPHHGVTVHLNWEICFPQYTHVKEGISPHHCSALASRNRPAFSVIVSHILSSLLYPHIITLKELVFSKLLLFKEVSLCLLYTSDAADER